MKTECSVMHLRKEEFSGKYFSFMAINNDNIFSWKHINTVQKKRNSSK